MASETLDMGTSSNIYNVAIYRIPTLMGTSSIHGGFDIAISTPEGKSSRKRTAWKARMKDLYGLPPQKWMGQSQFLAF